MPESDRKQPEEFSKSKRKQEMVDLQALGEQLIRLPLQQLDKIPLPHELLEAVQIARSLKSHEALRRQKQYIGKLMRAVDPELIKQALARVKFTNAK